MDPNTVVGKEIAEFLCQFGQPFAPGGTSGTANIPVGSGEGFARFTDRARRIVNIAQDTAMRWGRPAIDTEDLLIATAKEGSGVACFALKNLGLEEKLKEYSARFLLAVSKNQLPFTEQAKEVFALAGKTATAWEHPYIGTEHILYAMTEQPDSVAIRLLMGIGANLDDIRSEILDLLGIIPEPLIQTTHTDTKTMEILGPLQLNVMQHIWKAGEQNVHQVHDALNARPGVQQLAYTTILTVMRNAAKRGFLDQRVASGVRGHTFAPLVTEKDYKKQAVASMLKDLFQGDAEAMKGLLS